MENVGIFYGHFVYFMAIVYILWPFGIFSLVFAIYYQEKFGNSVVDHLVEYLYSCTVAAFSEEEDYLVPPFCY
jgi:hypothetical protein